MTAPALLWLDFETTDVDHDTLHLLEVAAHASYGVSNGHTFSTLIDDLRDAISFTAIRLAAPEVVREMHDANGLWADLRARAAGPALRNVRETEDALLALVDAAFEPGEDVFLAGAGVSHFDHEVIRRRMPRLAERLHYADVDISVAARTIEALTGTEVPRPRPLISSTPHRAESDVREARRRAALLPTMIRPRS